MNELETQLETPVDDTVIDYTPHFETMIINQEDILYYQEILINRLEVLLFFLMFLTTLILFNLLKRRKTK